MLRGTGETIHHLEYFKYAELPKFVMKNETVGVRLDTNKGKLSFVYNGQDLGPAFESPKLKSTNLYAYVSLTFSGDSVRCIGFN